MSDKLKSVKESQECKEFVKLSECGEKYRNCEPEFAAFDESEMPTSSFESSFVEIEMPLSVVKECQNGAPKFNFNSNQVTSLYGSWKSKIDKLKLLIHLRHNSYGLKWCEPVLSHKVVDFMKSECRMKKSDRVFDLSLRSKVINSRKQMISRRARNDRCEPMQTIVQLSNSLLDYNGNQSLYDQAISDFNLSLNSSGSDSFDNCGHNFTYFNLLSIPTLIIDSNSVSHANSVERFLNNQEEDEDLRVVVANDLTSMTENDKFIYF
ncbi:hypothetical protein BpHYR1_030699 [Brachionus plicatilis]|uniref:Uncharacterized protein n=1 Tax=Brachionus plicatilis TaxID=10195 RepID=A0A3M7SFH9_BRAPC|nr:hypothetical protein BpHYR1_030699 [Brachionus plicatilis]